ncbi:hypothetical protein [Marilutibacter spongiae]|uniref:Outer membrane lipoprotein carrier protein LolA n=1 Tax=Marilutibacter spongiae TaxID=2025720 RepID=A0A7W3Y5X2_9GAMM|nr:hypothetical protein [Lysobacter spongiae]MBB1060853.1 hypothetical protein [Lysobacter spongiae]
MESRTRLRARMRASFLLAAGALLAFQAAAAGPREELHEAYERFLAATSFRASLTDVAKGKTLTEMEFVAPDRYRVSVQGGPSQLVIGDAMYMDMGGRTMKLPMPAGNLVGQYRSREALEALERDLVVDALGADSVDGEPAKVYHYVTTQHGRADVKAWISDRSGLPLQLETTGKADGKSQTVRIRYRDFNDPSIRIAAPD